MKKVVELEDVEDLIKLIKERDMWNDWSSNWEECNEKVKKQIYFFEG